MAADSKLVQLYRSTNRTIELAVEDSTGRPYDLTGGVLYFTVKKKESDSSASFALDTADPVKGAIVEAKAGLVEFYVIPSNTSGLAVGTYVYDVHLVQGGKRYVVVAPSPLELLQAVGA